MPESDATLSSRLVPQVSVRTQLIAAAVMWAVGSAILLVRGVGYVLDAYWHAPVLGIALVLGVVKSRYLLDRTAAKAVARIQAQGKSWFLSFFSLRSWALVGLMMGGGILIRNLVSQPGVIGSGILGALYLGIGTALFIADRVFWHAAFRPSRTIADERRAP